MIVRPRFQVPVSEGFAVVERLPAAGVEEVDVALVVLVADGDGVAAQRDRRPVQRLWPHSLRKRQMGPLALVDQERKSPSYLERTCHFGLQTRRPS